jgi:hypothetical protein
MKIQNIKTPLDVYKWILAYLEQRDQNLVYDIVTSGDIAKINALISWDEIAQDLMLLHGCVNNSSVIDEETWTETRNKFIVAAFKDLSSFRNPEAMGIFEKLRNICTMNDGELFMWGRSVTDRPDGSAVIVLHVSNLEAFEKMLNKESGAGFLRDGLMLFR